MWNGGAYWEAMTQFATKVCGMPEVKCVTYTEYEKYLETLTPEVLAQYSKGNFPNMVAGVKAHFKPYPSTYVDPATFTEEDLKNPALMGDLPEAHEDLE
jgi:hypothetical protein